MNSVDVTWSRTFKVWWSYIWRCILFSMILGFILGFLGGVVVALIGRQELGAMVGGILGYLGSIPVSIIMLKKILVKKYSDFSVALVANENS
ncbi:hypothetical protein [Spongiibacter sp. UBA1325]|uniref:hypothetical protein n=1 Tax=Spongiibacter sp. UBA1325 TaxID=1947543 RepID=UPI00257CC6F4|nr:hypothetical protein [Spongiibacter sp. UBA1325]